MFFINIKGGLGNQMFQYALGVYLQKRYNHKVFFLKDYFLNFKIHNGYELEKVFGIKAHENNKLFKLSFPFLSYSFFLRFIIARPLFSKILPDYIIVSDAKIPKKINPKISYYFDGYWQNENLFTKLRSELLKDFKFKIFFSKEEKRLVSIITRSKVSVSVHVRRGDFLNNKKFWAKSVPCDIDYYIHAISELQISIPNLDLYYFSDDPDWVVENLLPLFPGLLIKQTNKNENYKDMYLMSLCKHNIIANSTFSWWAAWLNTSPQKSVIAPRFWLKNMPSKKIIPTGWKSL